MRKKYILGLVISVVLIVLILYKVDFKLVVHEIKNLKFGWVGAFVLLSCINCYIKGFRWNSLLVDFESVKKSSFKLMRFFTIGLMLNNFLPFRMGELIRAYITGKKLDIKKSIVFGTIIVERIFDTLSLVILLCIFFIISPQIEVPHLMRKTAGVGLVLGIVAFCFLIIISRRKSEIVKKLDALHNINFLKKFTKFIDSIMEGFYVLNHNHHIFRVALVSIFVWFLEAVTYYFIGRAFGLGLGVIPFIFVMVSICLGTMVPSGPGYIGVFEAATVAALVLFGINKEVAIAYALIIHTFQILLITTLGIIFTFKEKFTLKDFKLSGDWH